MPMATMADAHREWHRNTGVPMGTPGCPQDACHLPDDDHLADAPVTHRVVTTYGAVDCRSYEEAKQVARDAAQATGKSAKIERVASLEATPQEVQARAEAMATPSLDALAARMTGTPRVPTFERSDLEGLDYVKFDLLPQPSPAPSTEPSSGPPADRAGEPLYDGTYTVVETERTWRLKTQDADAEFAPGRQVLGYLSGPDNERDYTDFAFVVNGHPVVWSRHKGDFHLTQAAREFLRDLPAKVERGDVLLAARCFRCHRKLTVATSIFQGLGPECSKRGR